MAAMEIRETKRRTDREIRDLEYVYRQKARRLRENPPLALAMMHSEIELMAQIFDGKAALLRWVLGEN